MKVRVIKEMPFAKVGEMYEIGKKWIVENDWTTNALAFSDCEVLKMLRDGWLEEVKEEESLADMIRKYISCSENDAGVIVKLAESHFFSEEKIEKIKELPYAYYFIKEGISILKGESK